MGWSPGSDDGRLEREKHMKFENLFNIMHCDFFEVHKDGKIERIEYEMSGKMLEVSKTYFNDTVKNFYVIRSKKVANWG